MKTPVVETVILLSHPVLTDHVIRTVMVTVHRVILIITNNKDLYRHLPPCQTIERNTRNIVMATARRQGNKRKTVDIIEH